MFVSTSLPGGHPFSTGASNPCTIVSNAINMSKSFVHMSRSPVPPPSICCRYRHPFLPRPSLRLPERRRVAACRAGSPRHAVSEVGASLRATAHVRLLACLYLFILLVISIHVQLYPELTRVTV